MLDLNNSHGVAIDFFNIQFANGKWYAWYFVNINSIGGATNL